MERKDTSRRRVAGLLRLLAAFGGLLVLSLGIWLWSTDLEGLRAFAQGLVGARHAERIQSLFITGRLQMARWVAAVAVPLVCVLAVGVWLRSREWSARLGEDWAQLAERRRSIRAAIRALPAWQKGILWVGLALVAADALWFWHQMPLWEDEIVSYVSFSSRGFLVTLSYYPEPNNHVFFNLVVGVFRSLEWIGASPQVSFRLPSLLAFLATLSVVFRFLLPRRGFWVALSVAGYVGLSYRLMLYGVLGRGYSLQILLLVLLLVAAIRWRETGARVDRREMIVWGALGMWTIPTFLYPLLVVFGFLGLEILWQKAWPRLLALLRVGLWMVLWTLLAYLPIFLLNGVEAVVANRWVAPLPGAEFRTELPGYLAQTNAKIWGLDLPWVGAFLSAVAFGAAAFLGTRRYGIRTVVFLGLSLLLPLGLIVLQRLLPIARVWLPASLLSYALVGLLVAWLAGRLQRWVVPAAWLVGLGLLVAQQHHVIYHEVGELRTLNATAIRVVEFCEASEQQVVDLHDACYLPYLDYHALRLEVPLRVEVLDPGEAALCITPDTLPATEWQRLGEDSRVQWYLRRP